MTTTVIRTSSNTQLIESNTIEFMRAMTIRIDCNNIKPNAIYHVFMNGENIDRYVIQQDKDVNAPKKSSSTGDMILFFLVPNSRFKSGRKEFIITEHESLDSSILGLEGQLCSFTGIFTSTGKLQVYQTTKTIATVITIPPPPPPPRRRLDPLAQTFYTYGMTDGCWLTGIDIFFATKDSNAGVWLEVREVINGYPGRQKVSPDAHVWKHGSDISISSNASVATTFLFDKMIYLEGDKEYCFVIGGDTTKFNIWTSRLGETAKETNKTIFEQPHTGSLFLSENNNTWTASQFEDIKFTLYRAKFDTNVESSIDFSLTTDPIGITGEYFYTYKDTSKMLISLPFKHGLTTGSKIYIGCDAAGTYNGAEGSLFNKQFDVIAKIDDRKVSVNVSGATFTTHGNIKFGGVIHNIEVINGGSGYLSNNPPVVYIDGIDKSTGADPFVAVDISGGKIIRVRILKALTGYTSNVTISLTGTGTGAELAANNNASFGIMTNRVYQSCYPMLAIAQSSNTNVSATLGTTEAAFEGSSLSNYDQGKNYTIAVNDANLLDENLLLVSRFNEISNMSAGNSTVLNVKLASSNNFVSPVIDIPLSKVEMRGNIVNNYKYNRAGEITEDITELKSFGELTNIIIDNGGTGYTVAPTIHIAGNGSGGSAHAVVNAGVVTDIIIDVPGEYYDVPNIYFISDTGSGASANATISKYNSELKSDNGFANARYLTKKQSLDIPSNGIRLYATAYSGPQSSFEYYIKTSLSVDDTNHDDNEWKLLNCDVIRNKSTNRNDYREYEFYLDDIQDFDTYTLKCVLRSQRPWDVPVISSYRAIMII